MTSEESFEFGPADVPKLRRNSKSTGNSTIRPALEGESKYADRAESGNDAPPPDTCEGKLQEKQDQVQTICESLSTSDKEMNKVRKLPQSAHVGDLLANNRGRTLVAPRSLSSDDDDRDLKETYEIIDAEGGGTKLCLQLPRRSSDTVLHA
jgi:hypothetical protein